MIAAAFLLVAVICFILSVFGLDGRLLPAGLAFFAASFLAPLIS